MNRVAFPYVLQSPSSGSAIVGATATITLNVPGAPTLGGGAAAQIYTAQIGGSPLASNQITTDNLGRWTQGSSASYAQYWLPEGTYDITVSGTGLTTFVDTRELWSGTHVVEQGLVATAVQTAAYAANPQDAVPVDISASTFTVTLPTAPADGTRVQVKVVKVNATPGTYVAHVTCGGTDVLNIAGGVTGLTLTALGQGVTLKYQAATKIWLTTSDTPLGVPDGAASLDATSNVPIAQLGNLAPTIITASGAVAIPAGAGHMKVTLVGGGGGGGAGGGNGDASAFGGGGGGGGQFLVRLVPLAGVSGLSVTVGAGGIGGPNGEDGGVGGDTTLSGTGLTTITAYGGGEGWWGGIGSGIARGGGYGGSYGPTASGSGIIPGTGGSNTAHAANVLRDGGAGIGIGSAGGGSGGSQAVGGYLGGFPGGGDGGGYGNGAGANGTAPGSGGGGGSGNAVGTAGVGGAGSAGIAIFEWLP